MTIPFTPPVTNPNLKDVLAQLKKDVFLSLNCHAIGTVESFDYQKQTVTVSVNYTKTSYQRDELGNFDPVETNYPLLLDCPVVIISGGIGSLTMPIDVGDQCLVLFNDRDIDNWFSGATTGPVNSGRLHALSDAIALIGLFPMNDSITDYDTGRVVLKYGTTVVGIGQTKIELSNEDTTLNTLLQDLMTELQSLCTQLEALTVTGVTAGGAVSGPPANAAAIAAISANLSTIATEIGGLLQ